MSYKKRAKKDWGVGKSYKSESNRKERQYEKREIKQALQEELEGSDYRHPQKTKKRFDTKLEKDIHREKAWVQWYEKNIVTWKTRALGSGPTSWVGDIVARYESRLLESKEKLKKLLDKIKK